MGKHVGTYDLERDVEALLNEIMLHEPWCHWDCPGHRRCVCEDGYEKALRVQEYIKRNNLDEQRKSM